MKMHINSREYVAQLHWQQIHHTEISLIFSTTLQRSLLDLKITVILVEAKNSDFQKQAVSKSTAIYKLGT